MDLPLVNNEVDTGVDKKTKLLAEKYISTLDEYMKTVKYSDINIFKKMFITTKNEFKRSMIEELLKISEQNSINFFQGRDEQFQEQINHFKSLIKELRKKNTFDKTKEASDQKRQNKKDAEEEEDKKESGGLYQVLRKMFDSNQKRGEFVKDKIGMDNMNILQYLDPEAGLSAINGLFNKLIAPISAAIGVLVTQALGIISSGATPLLGGLVIAISDAWQAGIKHVDWGVDAMPAQIAGFLAGSDTVIRDQMLTSFGTYKNVAKWGLIGAGIGSFFPVLGTIVGGLIGASIGLFVTFLGPERIAKFIQRSFDTMRRLSDLIFGTKFFDETVIKSRIDEIQGNTNAHNKDIQSNLDKINSLRNDLQKAIASNDLTKQNSIKTEIGQLEQQNKEYKDDVASNLAEIKSLNDEMATVRKGRFQTLKEYMFGTDAEHEKIRAEISNQTHGIEGFSKKMLESRREYWGGIKANIQKRFWDCIGAIEHAFMKAFDVIMKIVKNIPHSIYESIKSNLKANMKGTYITEKIYEGMFGESISSGTGGRTEPKEYSPTLDYYNKAKDYIDGLFSQSSTPNFTKQENTDYLKALKKLEDDNKKDKLMWYNHFKPTIIHQNNSTSHNNVSKNYIPQSAYSKSTLYTTGGGVM